MRELLRQIYTIFYFHNPHSPYSLNRTDEFISHREVYFEKIKYFTKKYAHPFQSRKYDSDKDWDFSYPNEINLSNEITKNKDNTQEISYKIFEKYNFISNSQDMADHYIIFPASLKNFEYKNEFPNSKELRSIKLITSFGLNFLILIPSDEKVKNLITIYIKKLKLDETYFKYKIALFYQSNLLDPDDERYIGTVFKNWHSTYYFSC